MPRQLVQEGGESFRSHSDPSSSSFFLFFFYSSSLFISPSMAGKITMNALVGGLASPSSWLLEFR